MNLINVRLTFRAILYECAQALGRETDLAGYRLRPAAEHDTAWQTVLRRQSKLDCHVSSLLSDKIPSQLLHLEVFCLLTASSGALKASRERRFINLATV
jgi:hypothetical protein